MKTALCIHFITLVIFVHNFDIFKFDSLIYYVQAKHGKNLPANTCMLCGRACKDRRTLLKHNWEHSKEKIYGCSKCTKTFHNKARLKRHMLSHRNKVVTCDVCGEEFPDGRSLMNHRHSHTSVSGRQFPCRECGKTFGSRSSQQIHIRIHTGKIFVYHICDESMYKLIQN